MSFNIDEERIRLIQVISDDTFDYLKYVKEKAVALGKPHARFLWTVLTLTIKYPQVELYLKNLLNYFTIEELEEITNKWSILHKMVWNPGKISVNSFEIIINYGIDIKSNNSTVAHVLISGINKSHNYSILNLLIKYGADLNVRNGYGRTVLDVMTYHQEKLDEETKNCIITLVDFGSKTSNPKKNIVYDFIEYYKNLSIKPAIKNENKI